MPEDVLTELLGLRPLSAIAQDCTFDRASSKVSFITTVKFVRPIVFEGLPALKISIYPPRSRLAMA